MKIIFTLLLAIATLSSFAQESSNENYNKTTQNNCDVAYRLYPTKNMWTFIKLNTRNGQLWQVQFDVKGRNRFVSILSLERLANKENEVNNRFALYPTENMYNFILLDQLNGKTWQVQWSIEIENRFIIPIE